MTRYVHGNASYDDYPASTSLIFAYAVHLSYGVPSLIRYFTILYNIIHSSWYKVPFYKLFLADGIIVSLNYFKKYHRTFLEYHIIHIQHGY